MIALQALGSSKAVFSSYTHSSENEGGILVVRRIIAMLGMVLLVCATVLYATHHAPVAEAASLANAEKEIPKEFLKKYGLKVVESVPDGIQPLEFKSRGELETYLKEMTTIQPMTRVETLNQEFDSIQSTGYHVIRRTASNQYGTFSVNLIALIEIYMHPSGWQEFLGCTEATSLTGITFSLGWQELYTLHRYMGSEVYASGGGVLSQWLFVEGAGILVWSREEHMSLTHWLYI